MDLIELKANMRSIKGNGPGRSLRRAGFTPGILYGAKTEPIMLSINTHELELIVKQGNIGQLLLNLSIEDSDIPSKKAMIKELQQHPLTHQFLHVDLYEVLMDKKIRVSIPVVTSGKSKGVELGGMLQIIRREVDVLCYPNQIPEAITIDIAELDIGDSIHVEEIPLPEGIEIPAEVNFTVATVLSQKAEAEITDEDEGEEESEVDAEEEETRGE